MKKIISKNNITGYIEGYYGKLLSWESRRLIIKSLHKNNMNTYFYAPKEDVKHRLCWKISYSEKWLVKFRNFTKFGKRNKINIIAGIAPGLDFNFKELISESKKTNHTDFELLLKKAKLLIHNGANSIALLLDDIPNDFKKKFGNKITEGTYHGLLANKLQKQLGSDIFFVPRIYADELIQDEPIYLKELSKVLSPIVKVFYCGKTIVSKKLTNYKKINKVLPNEIIFWDNFYANDYCPRRLFIGPLIGRKNINNIMVNPTGLIHTDLLILDLFANCLNGNVSFKEWWKILENHKVPKAFLKIKKYFLRPDFDSNSLIQNNNIKNKELDALDLLLWKWKGQLSREWYNFIFGLKQDLQINKKLLPSDRIIKTQTIPLSKFLNKGELK